MSTTEPQPSSAFLSDLCLLAVLGEMNLKNRLAASKVCPRWFHRVREVNQAVQSIAIAFQRRENDWSELLDSNRGAIESKPSVKLLKKADGSPLYPLEPFIPGDCLQFVGSLELSGTTTTSAAVQQIIAAFPRVTQLLFLGVSNGEEYQHLVEMLQSPVWRGQLTRLSLFDRSQSSARLEQEQLFTAINGLTALRQLTLDLHGCLALLDLPILAQLETVRFEGSGGQVCEAFLRSLQQYGPSSGQLRVDLSDGDYMMGELTALDEGLRRRIVRLSNDSLWSDDYRLALLVPQFSSLSSLSLNCRPWHVRPIFAAISASLQQLLHLCLEVDFLGRFDFHNDTSWRGSDYDDDDDYGFNFSDHSFDEEDWEDKRPFDPPVAPLRSVQALELWLAATHEDLEWFNLPATMPALEAISLGVYYCRSCRRKYWKFNRKDYYDRETATKKWPHKCLRVVFGILGRTGVSPRQMSYLGEEAVCSVEELLNEEEEEED